MVKSFPACTAEANPPAASACTGWRDAQYKAELLAETQQQRQ
jgi:hypothetical protein